MTVHMSPLYFINLFICEFAVILYMWYGPTFCDWPFSLHTYMPTYFLSGHCIWINMILGPLVLARSVEVRRWHERLDRSFRPYPFCRICRFWSRPPWPEKMGKTGIWSPKKCGTHMESTQDIRCILFFLHFYEMLNAIRPRKKQKAPLTMVLPSILVH